MTACQLFGTVIGIINAFRAMGATGRGGVATVSTGIAEALVTTAFGILVAIPAVWLFNHLTQRNCSPPGRHRVRGRRARARTARAS